MNKTLLWLVVASAIGVATTCNKTEPLRIHRTAFFVPASLELDEFETDEPAESGSAAHSHVIELPEVNIERELESREL